MKRVTALAAVLILVCSLLSGCDLWMSGEYVSVTPHDERTEQTGDMVTEVSSYHQLQNVLNINVASCVDRIIVSASSFNDVMVDFYVQTAINQVLRDTPVGAYAVERIDYEIGTNRGEPVVVFKIEYRYPSTDILSIRNVHSTDEIVESAFEALAEGVSHIVLWTDNFEETDMDQQIENHLMTHGDITVELPVYRVSVYPKKGVERIVDISFEYEHDRVSLEKKQKEIENVLLTAEAQIKDLSQVLDIYKGFYTFLAEHIRYLKNSSNMPVYSALCEKTGDSKAFAMTFAAMCRRAELDSVVISGTLNNEQRYWNLVRFRGKYYHLDILSCINNGDFAIKTATEMSGYQWDTAKYPDT